MKDIKKFVCFDDSETDPTYAEVSTVSLVMSEAVEGYNPCTKEGGALVRIQSKPKSAQELEVLCGIMGWYMNVVDGEITLHTGIYDNQEDPQF